MARFHTLEFPDPPRQPVGDRTQQTAEPELTSGAAAVETHRDTVATSVQNEIFHMRAADEQFQMGRFEQALRLYSRALEGNPNLDSAWVGQVRMLIEMGELKEARVWADRALEIFPGHGELLAAKGVVAARLGDRTKSIEFSDAAAASREAGRSYVWLARGEVLLATRRKNVDFVLEKALSLARDWFTTLLVARIYYFYRHYARALVHAREAVEANMLSPFAWLVQGNCQEALAMSIPARDSYTQALTLDPDYEAARVALGTVRPAGALAFILAPWRKLRR